MKTIALFGGSFDPVHIGHTLVVNQILELRPEIEKIILIPALKHQWKQSYATNKDRLAMLDNLVSKRVEVSDIELKRKGISYTIDTAREIKKQTGAKIYWIVGSDILQEYKKWEKTEGLTTLMTFLVFPRDPYHIPKNVPPGFEVIKDKHLITINLSSTIIRERIRNNYPITHLVLPEVESYIKKHNLYK